MELSYETIRTLVLNRHDDWDYCSKYGEPGYSHSVNASTPLVVLGNYWCRCDKFGTDDHGNKLHSFEDHHPKVWAQMEVGRVPTG